MLQWWLGTRKRTTWNYLNPLQYSIDCDINIETSLRLFFTCAYYEDVKTFDVRTISRCPNCEAIIAKEYDTITIVNLPDFCEDCGLSLDKKYLKDDSEVYFSLVVDPLPPFPTPITPVGGESKTVDPLTFDKIANEAPKEVKGLIERMSNL